MARSLWNPRSPFQSTEVDWEGPPPDVRLQVLEDDARTILTENRFPDIPFRWGVNPYRGCTHACAYCYARRHHEFLGFGAGTDFETRVLVKKRAPELLETAFRKRSWKGETVAFSGATDCYQPLERRYRLTRGCLEVCARFRNPVGIITRSPLITRDLDLLVPLHARGALSVALSLPILDPTLCRAIEPGAPTPSQRLTAIRALTEAGIDVGVSIAPVIPGLNDRQVPEILRASREAGAKHAWMGLVRLAGNVAHVFAERATHALGAEHTASILRRIQVAHGGQLTGPMRPKEPDARGAAWGATRRLFDVWHARLGFEARTERTGPSPFRVPGTGRQLGLGW